MGLINDAKNGLLNRESLEEARKGKIHYIDLDDIQINPNNIGDISEEEVISRRENIKEVGLLQPLLVQQTDKGILLNTGHKRYMALKQLAAQGTSYRYMGKELNGVAPCQYLNADMDPADFDLIAIASNAHHPDSKEEKREKVWRLHQHYKKLIAEGNRPPGREREWITAMTGISDGTVKTLLAGFNAQEQALTEDVSFAQEEPKKDINSQITRKLTNVNRYLEKVELDTLTDYERKKLNDLLRSVQETLEALIYENH